VRGAGCGSLALLGASAGLSVIDPIAALGIAALAAKESVQLWQGYGDGCCAPIGFAPPGTDSCGAPGCDCC
jgi:hypothetical protein